MKRLAIAAAAGVVLLVGVLLGQVGIISFSGPRLPQFTDIDVQVTLPDEARIVAVEPISLDCRARVHAQVPVVGTREHQAFGQVYRTDRVTLDAIGDVDTCVDGHATTIEHKGDGTTEVVIPGESIVFVRPRVDTVATADSLTVSRGWIGKISDMFPWVDDNLGLTPLAYAYAQNVIGSSECMRAAYTVTEQILIEAYRAQLVEQGVDPDQLTVRIEGEPLFAEPEQIDMGDVNMQVGSGQISCVATDDLLSGVTRVAA